MLVGQKTIFHYLDTKHKAINQFMLQINAKREMIEYLSIYKLFDNILYINGIDFKY